MDDGQLAQWAERSERGRRDTAELGYLECTAMRGGSKNLKRPGAIKMVMLFRRLFLVVDQQ